MSNKLPLLIKYVEEMYLEGGPKLEHYVQLTNWFDNVHLARQEGGHRVRANAAPHGIWASDGYANDAEPWLA